MIVGGAGDEPHPGRLVDELVPVAAGDVEDVGALVVGRVRGGGRVGVVLVDALGGFLVVDLVGLWGLHQLYALRWSGGGTVPPLYSTGIPPSG